MLQEFIQLKDRIRGNVKQWEEEVGAIVNLATTAAQIKEEAEQLLNNIKNIAILSTEVSKPKKIRRATYINWDGVYKNLNSLFTNEDAQKVSGASAPNTTQKLTLWKKKKMVERVGRGIYRKISKVANIHPVDIPHETHEEAPLSTHTLSPQ